MTVYLSLNQIDPPNHDFSWCYLGENYLKLRSLNETLGKGTRISSGAHLSEATEKLREPFIGFIDSCGAPYGDDLSWWMTATSGKNINVSQLFLHCCYVEVVRNIVRLNPGTDLVIIVDNLFLLRALKEDLVQSNSAVMDSTPISTYLYSLAKLASWWCARWIKWIGISFYDLVLARISRFRSDVDEADSSKPLVIIRTCIDESAFGSQGHFNDRYFSGLDKFLTANGYRVKFIPWLYNISRSRRSAVEWFRSSTTSFTLIEDYTRFYDIFRPIIQILSSFRFLSCNSNFRGIKLFWLILSEKIRNSCDASAIKFYFYIPALKRFLEEGNEISIFVDAFENMGNERTPIYALRRCPSKPLVVGYQHAGGIAKNLLNYSVTLAEWKRGIYPDFIVANSCLSLDALNRYGIPRSNLRLGPATRYPYLLHREFRDTLDSNYILLPLPNDLPGAVELSYLILDFAKDIEALGLTVYLKAHPMAKESQIRKYLPEKLPKNWRWVTGPIFELLSNARVLVAENSTILESAALGVPFLCVGRELTITINPLEVMEDEYLCCGTVNKEQFLLRLQRAVTGEKEYRVEIRKKLASEISLSLGGMEEEYFRAFLPEERNRSTVGRGENSGTGN